MYHTFKLKERLKLLILVTLILTSLIQVGILWSYQQHRLPISFLYTFLGINESSDSEDWQYYRDTYFTPYRIVVSGGKDESHWSIYENTDKAKYDRLWKDTMEYLKVLPSLKAEELDVSAWADRVVSKRAFIFEFKTSFNGELVRKFLNITNSTSGENDDIYKIAVLPFEDSLNNNMNTLYVLGQNTLRRYTIPMDGSTSGREAKAIDKNEYDRIIKSYEQASGSGNYKFVRELLSNQAYLSQDILFMLAGNVNLNSVTYSVPPAFSAIRNPDNTDAIEQLMERIVGSEVGSYDHDLDVEKSNTVVFNNLYNVYKVTDSGMLEYKYKSVTSEARGDIAEAFSRAAAFIRDRADDRGSLISGGQLYLSDVYEEKDCYRFSFDYCVGDTSVMLDSKDPGGKLNNALVIRANSTRVTSCTWALKNFKRDNTARSYKVDFLSSMDRMFDRYGNLKANKSFFIKDIEIGYKMDAGATAGKAAEPVWVIRTKDEGNLYVPID